MLGYECMWIEIIIDLALLLRTSFHLSVTMPSESPDQTLH